MDYPSGELVTLYKLILDYEGTPSMGKREGDKYSINVKLPAGGHKDPSMTFTGSIDLVPNDQPYSKYDKRAGYNYFRGPGLGKMVRDPYVYKWYEDPWYEDWDYDDWDDFMQEDEWYMQEELERKKR